LFRELDGPIHHVARRIVMIEDLECVMARRMVQKGQRGVLHRGAGRQVGNRPIHRRPIEPGTHVQERQIPPELRHVGRAVVHHGRPDRRLLGVLNERQRPEHVPGTRVERYTLAVDAQPRAVGGEVRKQHIQILRKALVAEVRKDGDDAFRRRDLRPCLVERVAALRASRDVEEDERHSGGARGISRAVHVHVQRRAVRHVHRYSDGRRGRRRICEAPFLRTERCDDEAGEGAGGKESGHSERSLGRLRLVSVVFGTKGSNQCPESRDVGPTVGVCRLSRAIPKR
jgi:hypothetical protein